MIGAETTVGTEGAEPGCKEGRLGDLVVGRDGFLGCKRAPSFKGEKPPQRGIETPSGPCLGLTRSRGGGTTLQRQGEAAAPAGPWARAPGLTELAAGFRAAGDPTPFLLAHFLLWNGSVSHMLVSLLHTGSTPLGHRFVAGDVLCQRMNHTLSLTHT